MYLCQRQPMLTATSLNATTGLLALGWEHREFTSFQRGTLVLSALSTSLGGRGSVSPKASNIKPEDRL